MSQSYPAGVLPYSSTDPSILLKCSCTSLAAIAVPEIGPAGSFSGTGHTVNEAGFKPAATGNSGLEFINIPGYLDLDRAGQLSFECSSYALTYESGTPANSVGYTPVGGPGTEWLVVWRDAASGYGYFRKYNGNSLYISPNSLDPVTIVLLHSQKRPPGTFSRICFSWLGSKMDMWIDGYRVTPFQSGNRSNYLSGFMRSLYILSHFGGASPSRETTVRNVLLSTKPVQYPILSSNPSICIFGHSFVMTYGVDRDDTLNLDGQLLHLMRKYLAKQLGALPTIFAGGITGGFVDPASSADTTLYLNPRVAANMALSPTSIVVLAGTNDVSSGWSVSTFDAAFKTMITSMVTSPNGANLKKIVVCTVCSLIGKSNVDTPTIAANVASANVTINGLPAWFNATYPTLSGRLVIADIFTAWGGARPSDAVMLGQLAGTLLDAHPSYLGSDLIAKTIVEKLI